jgi:hypothetical protein
LSNIFTALYHRHHLCSILVDTNHRHRQMSVVKTTEEFSSRRKVRYGQPPDASSTSSLHRTSTNASFSPHKYFYGKDNEGHDAYFIEFNIGDFNFDEITIRTEGKTA